MFEQSIIPNTKTNKGWAIALAIVVQLAVIGALLCIPFLFLDPMPMPALTTMLAAPPAPPPPLAPPMARSARVNPRPFVPGQLFAPRAIPKTIAIIHDLPQPPSLQVAEGVVGGMTGGKIGGVLGGILNTLPTTARPLPPPTPKVVAHALPLPPKPAAPSVVHVGGDVEAARVISAPPPRYPPVASKARIQGTVRMEAIIAKDGHIASLRVLSGNPLLVHAAMDAVKQWIYRPTYLDGKAVQVDTDIAVNFRLRT